MCIHWSGSNHGKNSTHGESEGWSECCYTSTSFTESISFVSPTGSGSFRAPHRLIAGTASPRVRAAAGPIEAELRALARRLTLGEFHALRVRLEDFFDDCLLNGV
jgi:hypothetical protein